MPRAQPPRRGHCRGQHVWLGRIRGTPSPFAGNAATNIHHHRKQHETRSSPLYLFVVFSPAGCTNTQGWFGELAYLDRPGAKANVSFNRGFNLTPSHPNGPLPCILRNGLFFLCPIGWTDPVLFSLHFLHRNCVAWHTLLDKVIHFLKGCRGHRALLSLTEIFGCFDLYNTLSAVTKR